MMFREIKYIRNILFVVFAACSILFLVACEVDSQTPLYALEESAGVIADMSLQDAQSLMISQPINESELGVYKEDLKLSQSEYNKIYSFVTRLVAALYNHSYTTVKIEDLNDAYADMHIGLAQQIKNSDYYQKNIENIIKYKIFTLVTSADIAPGAYVRVYADDKNNTIYRVPVSIVLQTRGADPDIADGFYEARPWFVPGDSSVELWLYLIKQDDGFKLLRLQESITNPKKDILFTAENIEENNNIKATPKNKRDENATLLERQSLSDGTPIKIAKDKKALETIIKAFADKLYEFHPGVMTDQKQSELYEIMSVSLIDRLKKDNYLQRLSDEIDSKNIVAKINGEIKSETFIDGTIVSFDKKGKNVYLVGCFFDLNVSFDTPPSEEFFFAKGHQKINLAVLLTKEDNQYHIMDWSDSINSSEGPAD